MTRSHRMRVLIALLALWQVGIALIPHTGTPGSATRRPHWHALGATLELAHDELACRACNANHPGFTQPSARPIVARFLTYSPNWRGLQHLADLAQVSSHPSRGPPLFS